MPGLASAAGNPFEAVCEIAAAEKWCWDMLCGTCGHMLFRYAFQEIARGVAPGSGEWVVCKRDEHQLHALLGPMPRRLSLSQQQALADVVAGASMVVVSRNGHPDWLGYVGLGLRYTSDAEHSTRRLTMALVPQLIDMIAPGSPRVSWLQSLLADPQRVLEWTHLESIEHDLMIQGR